MFRTKSLSLCPCLEICYLRRRFAEQVAYFTCRIYIGDTGAFYFDNIMMVSAEDVKLFLLKQTYKSFLFLSETGYVLSGWQYPESASTKALATLFGTCPNSLYK